MTLGGWITFGTIAAFIATLCIAIPATAWENKKRKAIICAIVGITSIALLLVGMRAFYRNTESGKRAMKTWHSELNEGIERTVRVYDVKGDLIQEYIGKFDVDYDDDRIIFDDQDGKRHVIYYPTGTVIIDEL